MGKIRIAIDIDNVIADFEGAFRREINKKYNYELKRKDIKEFDFHKCTNLTEKQEQMLFNDFINNDGFVNLKLIRGSRENITKIKENNFIILITSRPKALRNITLEWFRRKRVPYDKIIWSKNKHLQKTKYDILIEDKFEYALDVAKKDRKVILIDYPWNRKNIFHRNIIRVKKWNDIVSVIRKLKEAQ